MRVKLSVLNIRPFAGLPSACPRGSAVFPLLNGESAQRSERSSDARLAPEVKYSWPPILESMRGPQDAQAQVPAP